MQAAGQAHAQLYTAVPPRDAATRPERQGALTDFFTHALTSGGHAHGHREIAQGLTKAVLYRIPKKHLWTECMVQVVVAARQRFAQEHGEHLSVDGVCSC